MPRNSLAKRAGGRRAAGASSRRFVRARAMVIASTPRQRRVWCHAAAVASHAFQQLSPGSLESSRAGRTGRATSGAQRRGARPRHSVRARRGPELSARQLAVGNEKGQILEYDRSPGDLDRVQEAQREQQQLQTEVDGGRVGERRRREAAPQRRRR